MSLRTKENIMGPIQAATYTDSDLEVLADQIKAVVIDELVVEDFLSKDIADQWCADHTVLFRKKAVFRTITNWWRKEKAQRCLVVVKKSPSPKPEKGDET